VKAVVFVPYTSHSNLANGLRTNEEKLEGMTGSRMKVVEKGGIKLVDLLHKANPWAGQDCGRDRCMLCKTKKGKKNSQDCEKKLHDKPTLAGHGDRKEERSRFRKRRGKQEDTFM
jgi:hypothetical protein